MNKHGIALLGLLLLFNLGTPQLSAVEGDIQSLGYVSILLNNEYLLENARLIALAEQSYAIGKYDDAVKYATEAIRFADLSDAYVSSQMRLREVNEAIASAQARIEWAQKIGAPNRFAEAYGKAENAMGDALDHRSQENWDGALGSARSVLSILSEFPDEQPAQPEQTGKPVLPAQYLVRTWIPTKDCLWNIAGKPEIYGDPWQWRRLYNANIDKMPKRDDPDLIHPGMILDIPSIRGEVRSGIMEQR
ncbi:MAG: LysM peptidoglycan-binding domain-containing protein [Treponema sp.]|nr:LysM peptidoglycan-binding domain-containing protein [Treponema sp.]